MTRRELFKLAAKLGVVGLGSSIPDLSYARVSRSLDPVFLNVNSRPYNFSNPLPRLVQSLLNRGNGSSNWGYDRYRKDVSSNWGDFPTDTPSITWGYNVDGGQWFEASTTTGGVTRVWASFGQTVVAGETYLVSLTVDSKSGTHGNNNIEFTGGPTFSGLTVLNNPSPGRYVFGGKCTAGGALVVRMGIGTSNTNNNNATIRFSNVMIERVPEGTTFPSEYVRPGDQQVFNYTRSGSVSTGLVGVATHGTPYSLPRRSSILLLGDSYANDPGDYPTWLRYYLQKQPIAVNGMGEAGAAIAGITTQIANEVARQQSTPGAYPYKLCIAHGGVNDVNSNRTLLQMQTDRLAQISAITAAGMYPILLTTSPLNAATGGQQTVMDGYNAWLKTLGYPLYDLFTDAADGSKDFKTTWGSVDGVHPSSAVGKGYDIMGRRLADLIMLINS